MAGFCIYRDEDESKVIDESEWPEYRAKGWFDAPKGYNQRNESGVEAVPVTVAEQAEDEPVEGESVPFDVDGCESKEELEAYAKARFGVDIDKRRSLDRLKDEVKALEESSNG